MLPTQTQSKTLTIEERMATLGPNTERMEAVKTIGLFLAELEKGSVRAAVVQPDERIELVAGERVHRDAERCTDGRPLASVGPAPRSAHPRRWSVGAWCRWRCCWR